MKAPETTSNHLVQAIHYRALMIAMVAASYACGGSTDPSGRDRLLGDMGANANAEVLEGCQIAVVKCTSCHHLSRILKTKVSSPAGWKAYVRRMRQQPGAHIGSRDETLIVGCLVYRAFGDKGLASLKEKSN